MNRSPSKNRPSDAAPTTRAVSSSPWYRLRLLTPAALAVFALTATKADAQPTIYTIGDSTVQTWASGYYPKAGWGQVLPKFFDTSHVNVVNKAVGGTSSKSFFTYYWTGVRNSLVAGDYVFIQFGINDRASDPERHTDAYTTFKDYLRRYVNDTRARGAHPVIVATLRRNSWNADGVTVYDAYHDHPIAARQLAAEMNVPCVDLDGKSKTLMEALGKTYCTYYWYMNMSPGEWPNYPNGQADNVHFHEAGAIEMARLVVESIRESSYANMQALVPALRPTYPITFTRNNANGMITRSQVLPQGLTITALARPNSGQSFLNWSGSFSSNSRIARFTSGSSAMNILATFSGGGSLPGTHQGESAVFSGGAFAESTNSGFRGSGYVNFPLNGGSASFNSVDGSSGGAKKLTIRYANGSGAARTGALVVNGVSSSITFPATSSWTSWATLDVSITLVAGTSNTIALRSTGSDLANIDEIAIADAPAAGTTYPSENAALSGGAFVESTNSGFNGSAYVNFPANGGVCRFNSVDGSTGGAMTLVIRYANGSGNARTGQLVVNGVTTSLTFPTTSAWTSWNTLSLSVTLTSGTSNTIDLRSIGSDLANIDEIRIQ
jgi:lysophospholipase L1-like esterase